MRRHNSQLEFLLGLLHVGITLGQYGPRCWGARLDADDFLHYANGRGNIIINERLIAFAYQSFNLLG